MNQHDPARGPTNAQGPPGERWIRRAGVVRLLSTVPDYVPLVLVVAPPGYGKTTAVSQWAVTTSSKVARVRITREHRDRATLVHDLALALLRVGPLGGATGWLAAAARDVPPEEAAQWLASATTDI